MNMQIVKEKDHCGITSNLGAAHADLRFYYTDILRPEVTHNLIDGIEHVFKLSVTQEVSDKFMAAIELLPPGPNGKPNYVMEFLGYIVGKVAELKEGSPVEDKDIKRYPEMVAAALEKILNGIKNKEIDTSDLERALKLHEQGTVIDETPLEIRVTVMENEDKTEIGCKLSFRKSYAGFVLSKDGTGDDELIMGDDDAKESKSRTIKLDVPLRELLLKDIEVTQSNEAINFIFYLIDSKDFYFAEEVTLAKFKKHVLGPPWNLWEHKFVN